MECDGERREAEQEALETAYRINPDWGTAVRMPNNDHPAGSIHPSPVGLSGQLLISPMVTSSPTSIRAAPSSGVRPFAWSPLPSTP